MLKLASKENTMMNFENNLNSQRKKVICARMFFSQLQLKINLRKMAPLFTLISNKLKLSLNDMCRQIIAYLQCCPSRFSTAFQNFLDTIPCRGFVIASAIISFDGRWRPSVFFYDISTLFSAVSFIPIFDRTIFLLFDSHELFKATLSGYLEARCSPS